MLFNSDGIQYRAEDFLFKQDERIPDSEISGDEKVLNSPLIEEAFQRILADYVPHHDKVIFSLCTSTRPYLHSVKWKTYHKFFGTDCDLVICSNGGIIPMDYMYCYPFLNYNAPHEGNAWDELYMKVFERRLCAFLEKNNKYYKKRCFVFIPETRNYRSIEKLKLTNSLFMESALIPDRKTYRKVLNGEDLYIGFPIQRYPTLSYSVLLQIEQYLGIRSTSFHELVKQYENKINKDMNIRDVIKHIYETIDYSEGYTINELIQMGMNICNVYKPSYIASGVKASTNNIDMKVSGYGQYNKNYFYYENDMYYKYTSQEEYNKHKANRLVNAEGLF